MSTLIFYAWLLCDNHDNLLPDVQRTDSRVQVCGEARSVFVAQTTMIPSLPELERKVPAEETRRF